MEMSVETTVTLHLKNDNYLKQKAGLTASEMQILHFIRSREIVGMAEDEIRKGKTIALDKKTVKEAFDAMHELVDEAVWTAIDKELETLEGK